jgi:hypothetical protein
MHTTDTIRTAAATTHTRGTPLMLRIIPVIVIIACVLALAADAVASTPPVPASPAKGETVTMDLDTPRAVALTDARRAPTFMHYVAPRGTSPAVPCAPTDTSAYRWNGRALGPQYRLHTRKGDAHAWDILTPRNYVVGAVWFMDRTQRFVNYSPRSVLVAAWCEVD